MMCFLKHTAWSLGFCLLPWKAVITGITYICRDGPLLKGAQSKAKGTSRLELNGGGISQPSNSKVFSFGAQKVKHLLATHCKHVSVFNMLPVLCSPAHVFRKETGYDV